MFKTTLMTLSLLAVFTGSSLVHAQNQSGQRQGPPQFSELDLDGDGSVTLEEFEQHEVPHGTHEEIFSHIDSNEDGSISEDELTNHKPPGGQGGNR
jgi:hypothetical protein